ncbi:hypothetical protein CEUSTIGMA_g287.t1 [Chlamydomonas eustigma]|uniref:DNA replication complex GINS protein PSF2 n=1 Tax=Chlamydomonas eustigma TaxID=1157962 RepID=A0A250WQ92_9CHLO|nr:hypothetical protein CEUSTIGMA_g287.t1 [Chlamydomonas eustigma]|eukprot:GAX72832.1 hypothetical protein CEUSTIGMA_g287.t1 [Chlamydomonas eustigma]
MASTSGTSLFSYYGSNVSNSGRQLPVTPEELEMFAEQEMITIVPNFSLDRGSVLYCIGDCYGPFQANSQIEVPIWLALTLRKRNKCTIIPPDWLSKDRLTNMLAEEKESVHFFQPLPFYYVEISKLLFQDAVDAFGENYLEVTGLIESIRKVRYHKIESGLRKVTHAVEIKLNNLAAAECNMIRLLLNGTLDHFHQLSKNNKAWEESRLASGNMSMPFSGGLSASGF